MSEQKVEIISSRPVTALIEEIAAEAVRLIKLAGHRTLGQTAFRIEGEEKEKERGAIRRHKG